MVGVGKFGFEAGHYDVSMACAERVLLPAVHGASPDTRAQPAPGITAFTGGALDQIPLYPRREPLGARNKTTTISQQSFQATGAFSLLVRPR